MLGRQEGIPLLKADTTGILGRQEGTPLLKADKTGMLGRQEGTPLLKADQQDGRPIYYDIYSVLMAVGITCLVCFGVSLFAMQTKYDFTGCGGFLFVGVLVLFIFGLIALITFPWVPIPQTVYAGLGALLFALFLAYDAQLVVGGKRHELSPEEYIAGALQLYLDIAYIFLFILQLVGSRGN
ncbi:FAIM2 [Branchiostoma lanceolatum]|uniref:FAIM2 protein n=1 Tax=Branchiostoma lanceolatum TaxID=7740 RepID=A0A8S4MP40_BRALA|nr:FAIM2 [Branchiostoma lanceolatum]